VTGGGFPDPSSQISRGRRYQAVYATDDTLSPGRAVEHTTAEFDALFRAHYRRICRVIYRIVGQPDLAESLAAEAFWKLHQRRPAHLTNAEAWLCRTAVRLALDSLRKDKRRVRYESAAPPPASLACLILLLVPTTRTAAQRLWDVFFAERVEFVRLDIDKLPRSLTEQKIRVEGAYTEVASIEEAERHVFFRPRLPDGSLAAAAAGKPRFQVAGAVSLEVQRSRPTRK
jgi:DNA-directed RNA polymerase specialized sigma24 family protein